MQTIQSQPCAAPATLNLPPSGTLSPAGMALHLRRSGGDAALCFAQAIYDDSAWANESWAAFWAEIIRLI